MGLSSGQLKQKKGENATTTTVLPYGEKDKDDEFPRCTTTEVHLAFTPSPVFPLSFRFESR